MKEMYEKLGLFYLGKDVEEEGAQEVLTLLKNKNLTTHAAIIGMTGSGKTGLGIALIEEATLDNIPSIIIDPKGDMGNLCFVSPRYEAKDFEPWVGSAQKAEKTANMWKNGIESWDQSVERSSKLAQTDVTIYTPGSSAGVSVNILSSLQRPSKEITEDSDLFASYLNATVSSLLSLIDINAEGLHSKEYTLMSSIIARTWQNSEDLTLEKLIASIINPPFDKIGFLPLQDFYTSSERFKLATRFNSVVANPGFASWLEGEPLDIDALLYDNNANAKVSIFSIAHLNDTERMFFVTMLLNKYVAWMRRQSGTSALKTLLYMDEVYGFFPPSKNPPSKEPMMLLLKQARAFGVGVVLSTQNPVDLDYKGLSNIGTWFIGRLQTRQDIDKVIDGLSGKIGSDLTKDEIKKMLAALKPRTFFLKSAHLDRVRVFQTRWVLSYLKGPLKRDEIKALMADKKGQKVPAAIVNEASEKSDESYSDVVHIQDNIPQYFDALSASKLYPLLAVKAEIRFYNQSKGVNENEHIILELPLDEESNVLAWEDALQSDKEYTALPIKAPSDASYARVPIMLEGRQALKQIERSLKEYLYHHKTLELYSVTKPRLLSAPYETLTAFKIRLQDKLNAQKEDEIEALKGRYRTKEKRLQERYLKAQNRLSKEEADVSAKTTDTFVSAGIAVFGALFGSRSTSRIGSTINKGSRILKEQKDVTRAQQRLEEIERMFEELEAELEEKINVIDERFTLDDFAIKTYALKPLKRDVVVNDIALVWRGIN